MCVGNCNFLDLHLGWHYISNTYNLISNPIHMLVTNKVFLSSLVYKQYVHMTFHIFCILKLLCESYFITVHYKLGILLASTNQINFNFYHNKFDLYDRLFSLINALYIYCGNIPVEAYPYNFPL